jgi:hypothetical protein
MEINACRKAFPNHYIRVTAFDSTHGTESVAMILHRQPAEARARLPPGAHRGGAGARSATHRELRGRQAPKASATTDRTRGVVASPRWTPGSDRRHRFDAPETPTPDRGRSNPRASSGAARQLDASWSGWRRSRAHPRHRGAAADRPRCGAEVGPAVATSAVAAHVLHRQSRHRQDDGGDAHGARSSSSWATCARATWSR